MVESTQASTAELEGWQPADGAGRVVGCQLRWVESAHGWSLCSKTLKPKSEGYLHSVGGSCMVHYSDAQLARQVSVHR